MHDPEDYRRTVEKFLRFERWPFGNMRDSWEGSSWPNDWDNPHYFSLGPERQSNDGCGPVAYHYQNGAIIVPYFGRGNAGKAAALNALCMALGTEWRFDGENYRTWFFKGKPDWDRDLLRKGSFVVLREAGSYPSPPDDDRIIGAPLEMNRAVLAFLDDEELSIDGFHVQKRARYSRAEISVVTPSGQRKRIAYEVDGAIYADHAAFQRRNLPVLNLISAHLLTGHRFTYERPKPTVNEYLRIVKAPPGVHVNGRPLKREGRRCRLDWDRDPDWSYNDEH